MSADFFARFDLLPPARCAISKPPPISDDEKAEFLAAITGARPLKSNGNARVKQQGKLPSATPLQLAADEEQALMELHDGSADALIETGDELFFKRPGLQHSVIRKLKRGQYRMDDELDLHGYTVPEARKALAQYLSAALTSGKRAVRIIHGKGTRSGARGPVIKNQVAYWLAQRDEVLAYCSALPRHGGTGAVYVLLRKKDI